MGNSVIVSAAFSANTTINRRAAPPRSIKTPTAGFAFGKLQKNA
jgi:hypothetical protein